MPRFNFVSENDRLEIPTVEFRNAVVEVLRAQHTTKRGITDGPELSLAEQRSPRKAIFIKAQEDIPRYSIFTVTYISGTGSFIATGTGTTGNAQESMGFNRKEPRAYSEQFTSDSAAIYVVNEGRELAAGGNYLLDILGDEKPRLVTYDAADGIPNVGDPLGAKEGTYKVSMSETGLLAVSGPDVVNDLIWAIRISGAGTTGDYVEFQIDSVASDLSYATVEITARECGGSRTGFIDVYDAYGVWLLEPESDLIGRPGGAKYVEAVESSGTGTGTGTGTDETSACQWRFCWLACAQCEVI